MSFSILYIFYDIILCLFKVNNSHYFYVIIIEEIKNFKILYF